MVLPPDAYRCGDLVPDILHGPLDICHRAAMTARAHGPPHVHNVNCSLLIRHDVGISERQSAGRRTEDEGYTKTRQTRDISLLGLRQTRWHMTSLDL